MSDKIRIFVGIPLADATRQALAGLQEALRRKTPALRSKLRFTAPEQLHLTVKFVGWIASDRLDAFSELVLSQAACGAAVETSLACISGYPTLRRARVLVAELADPGARLAELAERFDAAAALLGVERERRPFRPHVTLARANPPTNLTSCEDLPVPPGAVQLTELVLFRSQPRPSGSVYTSLCRGALRAANDARD